MSLQACELPPRPWSLGSAHVLSLASPALQPLLPPVPVSRGCVHAASSSCTARALVSESLLKHRKWLHTVTLRPLCGREDSFLEKSHHTDRVHFGDQTSQGSFHMETPSMDPSASMPVSGWLLHLGMPSEVPADLCLLNSRALNVCKPPRMFQLSLQPTESHLHTTCPEVHFMGGRADFVPHSVACPCWVDCAEPSLWGRGTPGKGAALWCLHVGDQPKLSHEMCTLFSQFLPD